MKPAEQVRMVAMYLGDSAYSNVLRQNAALLDECERVLDALYYAYGRQGFDDTAYDDARATLAKLRGEA